uniref:TRM13 domain-containing protein n=1 Tax=Steinernema glaseri TaxID=37863 RepID=A0A1I8AAU9_9BILA
FVPQLKHAPLPFLALRLTTEFLAKRCGFGDVVLDEGACPRQKRFVRREIHEDSSERVLARHIRQELDRTRRGCTIGQLCSEPLVDVILKQL